MRDDQFDPVDPTSQHFSGKFGEQQIAYPGLSDDMSPVPDHGEETYRGTGRLQDRKAVITGGDSGIGRAVAIAFAREGCDVLLSYLPEEEKDARETERWVVDAGRRAVLVPGDIQDEEHCAEIIRRAIGELGGLDILVNNAAYQMAIDGIDSLSTDQLMRTFQTNVFAMVWLCKFAIPHLRPGASIINTSSIQAFSPSPHLLDYAATKAAIINYTKNLAQEVMEQGIRVNSVAPGPIWTPLIPATMPPEKVSSFGQDTPMGRPGQPAEIAPAFVYFASQESSYVTGEVLGVTGGKLMPS